MDADIVAALNGLLEEERAGVETLVGLVAMATDPFERQALTAMGNQAVEGCIELRERLERLGAPISLRVAHSVGRVLGRERIDDRLRAYGEIQRYLAGRCEALQERQLDDQTRTLLAALRAVQLAHAAWSDHRASDFAATRPSDVESSSPSHPAPRGEDAPALAADAPDTSDPLVIAAQAPPAATPPLDGELAGNADQLTADGADAPATDRPLDEPPAPPRVVRRATTPRATTPRAPTPRTRRAPLSAPAAKRRGKQMP